ncbi:MAG: DUF302 domain-containing protein [Phaeodactylibacter sp.]|nr:DUF302 domain-containing protein [Phaeodactylibacter sp.]MCB9051802.1 DUF302 domain-containing protein [Lewinellaceae bacterium]
MVYYFSKTIEGDVQGVASQVRAALKKYGFGVISEIDIQKTFKEKLAEDFRPYLILGACNPHFAYQALQSEDKIGTMLPCNIIIQQVDEGSVEVAAVDPAASMSAVENQDLGNIAHNVRARLRELVEEL